jgi:hypothetical protein
MVIKKPCRFHSAYFYLSLVCTAPLVPPRNRRHTSVEIVSFLQNLLNRLVRCMNALGAWIRKQEEMHMSNAATCGLGT